MKSQSVPKQLLVFIAVTCTIIVGVCVMLFMMLRTAYRESNDTAAAGIADAMRGFTLLDRVAMTQSGLQAVMRIKDPDDIEKALQAIEESERLVSELARTAGPVGVAVQTRFDAAIAARKQAIEPFLRGDVGAANERIMSLANPAYALVQDELRRNFDFDAARKSTAAKMADNEAQAWRSVSWRFALLGVLIAGVTGYLWRMRARITGALRHTATDLRHTAALSLSSSEQVSRSSQSLSQGATQQAASLEETSASMEEMGSMTRKNAENSQQAARLMSTVDAQVRESNRALDDMVGSMAAIQASSQQVAKIIKTIDEIAFQTNILALNAAVEAARAGEAGMGFAVVADEVRNLAQRSAQAARDTAGLIDESMARAKTGTAKVNQIASAISGITAGVSKVKGLVEEVSIASREQAQGFDQVSQAIAQMEKVTQTTAATAEQTAAASEELSAQAETTMGAVRDLELLVGGAAATGEQVKDAAVEPKAPTTVRSIARRAVADTMRRPRPAPKPKAADAMTLAGTGTSGRF